MPVNGSLNVSVVPNPTNVKITSTTTIDYSIDITNNGNIYLNNVTFSSAILGITNELVADKLAPGEIKHVDKKLQNINEFMIVNNEIKNEVYARGLYSTDDNKVADNTGYGITTVQKEKVGFPEAKTDITYTGEEQVGIKEDTFNTSGLEADAYLSATDAGTYTCTFTLKP